MREAAIETLGSGNPARARTMAEVLLARDPTDVVGLRIAYESALAMGDNEAAVDLGRRLWRQAESDDSRAATARLTALALARNGQFTAAQFWLRRAAQFAQDEATSAEIARNYQQVRQRNPWQLNLAFSLSPSSNVNGGSSSEIVEIDGEPVTFFGLVGRIPDEQQALSGWTYSADLRVSRRLSASDTQRTALSFRLYGRGVALSDAARDEAPGAENADYASIYSALTLSHLRAQPDGTLAEPVGPAQLTFTAGLEARRYPDFQALIPVPGGREDLRGWAGVTAGFTDWSYAGFAPVVSLEASRTESNVSNYERSAVSVGFSFRSTF